MAEFSLGGRSPEISIQRGLSAAPILREYADRPGHIPLSRAPSLGFGGFLYHLWFLQSVIFGINIYFGLDTSF